MTVIVHDTLPVEEHIPTIITMTDYNIIICYIVAIAFGSFLFDLIIHQVIEVIRKINRRQKNIQDIETNTLLESVKMSEFGKRFLRGGRFGR